MDLFYLAILEGNNIWKAEKLWYIRYSYGLNKNCVNFGKRAIRNRTIHRMPKNSRVV